jgi:hypothetical protein
MKLGKVLATTAVSGMLAALSGCGAGAASGGGESITPATPATDVPSIGDKNCCKGKNACKGKSGCKTQTNAACAGQNDCKGKGTSCPKG